MKKLLTALASIAMTASALCGPLSVDKLSEADFGLAISSGTYSAFASYRVGDSLSQDFPYVSTGEPELLLGPTPSTITRTAQYDWPQNWMSSTFYLNFHSADRTLWFSIYSSDSNGRPASASLTLSNVGNFDSLLLAGTADIAAMYVSPLTINGNHLPNLSPNGRSAHFSGFRITGDILNDDFSIVGSTYFDGGLQMGDSNKLEFSLMQSRQVPEPNTIALFGLSFGALALARRRGHFKA